MKKKIDVYEYMGEILKGVKSGVLITGKDENKTNSMTISWGMAGIEWGKPVFVTFIRESRFTKTFIDKNGEFTGRDVDKAKELGLTYEEPETISVPGIRELPLTLECKVIYKQTQDIHAITEEDQEKFYPQNADGSQDIHVAYYGEIVNAYVIE